MFAVVELIGCIFEYPDKLFTNFIKINFLFSDEENRIPSEL